MCTSKVCKNKNDHFAQKVLFCVLALSVLFIYSQNYCSSTSAGSGRDT